MPKPIGAFDNSAALVDFSFEFEGQPSPIPNEGTYTAVVGGDSFNVNVGPVEQISAASPDLSVGSFVSGDNLEFNGTVSTGGTNAYSLGFRFQSTGSTGTDGYVTTFSILSSGFAQLFRLARDGASWSVIVGSTPVSLVVTAGVMTTVIVDLDWSGGTFEVFQDGVSRGSGALSGGVDASGIFCETSGPCLQSFWRKYNAILTPAQRADEFADAWTSLGGATSAPVDFAGTGAESSSFAGDAAVGVELGGTGAESSSFAGDAAVGVGLGGTGVESSSFAGDAAAGVELGATGVESSSFAGEVDQSASVDLSGTGAESSSFAGDVVEGHVFSGTGAESSSFAGDVVEGHVFSGTGAESSTFSGLVEVEGAMVPFDMDALQFGVNTDNQVDWRPNYLNDCAIGRRAYGGTFEAIMPSVRGTMIVRWPNVGAVLNSVGNVDVGSPVSGSFVDDGTVNGQRQITVPMQGPPGNWFVQWASDPGDFTAIVSGSEGERFHQDYVSAFGLLTAQGATTLRLMNVNDTNDAPHTFASRTLETDRVFRGTSQQGPSYEDQFLFAVEAGFSAVWVNVPAPYEQSDWESLIDLCADSRFAGLYFYFEHSNEVWNWTGIGGTFNQGTIVQAQADADPNFTAANTTYRHREYHAVKTGRIGLYAKTVLGSRCRVLLGSTAPEWNVDPVPPNSTAGGTLDTFFQDIELAAAQNYGGGNVLGGIDYMAVAPYFGLTRGPYTEASSDPATVEAYNNNLYDLLELDVVLAGSAMEAAVNYYNSTYGLRVCVYESGNHLLPENPFGSAQVATNYESFTNSPRMRDLYQWQFDGWRRAGVSGPSCGFGFVGTQQNQFGNWDVIPDIYVDPQDYDRYRSWEYAISAFSRVGDLQVKDDVFSYTWLHSLFEQTFVGEQDPPGSIPDDVNRYVALHQVDLALQSGLTGSAVGQYGGPNDTPPYPSSTWGNSFGDNGSTLDLDNGYATGGASNLVDFRNSPIDHGIIGDNNFIRPNAGWPANISGLLDRVEGSDGQKPNIEWWLYSLIPEWSAFSAAAFATWRDGDGLTYSEQTKGYLPGLSAYGVRLIPVNEVCLALLDPVDGVLNDFVYTDIAVDNAPHGTGNYYLLAGLVHFMCLYGRQPTHTFEPSQGGIDPRISARWSDIVDQSWETVLAETLAPSTRLFGGTGVESSSFAGEVAVEDLTVSLSGSSAESSSFAGDVAVGVGLSGTGVESSSFAGEVAEEVPGVAALVGTGAESSSFAGSAAQGLLLSSTGAESSSFAGDAAVGVGLGGTGVESSSFAGEVDVELLSTLAGIGSEVSAFAASVSVGLSLSATAAESSSFAGEVEAAGALLEGVFSSGVP